MKSVIAILVAGFVALSSFGFDDSEAEERGSDHHEHQGITDAAPGQASHAHGDSDDHHDTPTSPCHHHVIHCGCGHSHLLMTGQLRSGMDEGESQIIDAIVANVRLTPVAQDLFHVPLA